MNIPKIIFIVPFRDRDYLKNFFLVYMNYIMEDYDKLDYEIYFSHQCDTRKFNRGAIKNLGFLAMSQKYPDNFKEITFVFNDIDTIPSFKNQLKYETNKGTIKHFFGFEFALGGILSIKGEDFLKLNGFPNFWGWGLEDNLLKKRADENNIIIDRSNFYDFLDKNIINIDKDPNKIISKNPITKLSLGIKSNIGLNTLCNIYFKINDNFINIYKFDDSVIPYHKEVFTNQNLDVTGNKLKNKFRFEGKLKMRF